MSNNKKAALIQHWNELGQDRPWRELAQMFDIKSTDGSISGELARCIVKNYRKKLKEQVEEESATPELKLKSKWFNGSTWCESYTAPKEGETSTEEFRKKLIDEVSKFSPKVKKTVFKSNGKNKISLEVSLPDLHFGKGDTDKLKYNVFNSVNTLLDKVSGYSIEEIVLPIGNDLMNSEGITRATTKGTPQTDSLHWTESFQQAWKTLAGVIEILQEIAPVKVINIYGNHDLSRTFYVGDVLTAWFRNNENVIVDNNYDAFKFHNYGKCMLMFNHGDNVKPFDLPLIMATEQPELFAKTKHREVHLGHVHKEQTNEYRGIKVRFLPSICSQDEWHRFQGYDSYRCAQAFLWNKETGLEGFFQNNIV